MDTTVQEKAIAFPTDARLYCKSICRLAKRARARGIQLRQSYKRKVKQLFFQQGCYARAKQFKRAAKCQKKLKNILGSLLRDIVRKCPQPDNQLAVLLERAGRIYTQQKQDSHKLYSLDAPEVECIGKGKTEKKYEFGCKVSLAVTHKGNWITAVQALHGNPYDGHTLAGTVALSERLSGQTVKAVYVDRGYRLHDYEGSATVYQQGYSKVIGWLKKKLRRRSAVEPTIGHAKKDNRMGRNYLKGVLGDKINAILAAAGYNLRKLLSAFCCADFGGENGFAAGDFYAW